MEGDPATTGRWGPSAVLLPAGDLAAALDALTHEILAVAGGRHWASGTLGAAHFTVRALERFGTPAGPGQLAALVRAARSPVRLEVTAIRMTDTAVVAAAVSPDGSADRLRRRYADELATDGWLEDAVLAAPRTIWYSTLLHYAAPGADLDAVARWVEARRSLAVAAAVFDEVHVCDWRFDGRRMVPVTVASASLARG